MCMYVNVNAKKKKCSGREHTKTVVVVILRKGSEIQGKGWE